MKEIDNFGVT